jgi:hypothetical protein
MVFERYYGVESGCAGYVYGVMRGVMIKKYRHCSIAVMLLVLIKICG